MDEAITKYNLFRWKNDDVHMSHMVSVTELSGSSILYSWFVPSIHLIIDALVNTMYFKHTKQQGFPGNSNVDMIFFR